MEYKSPETIVIWSLPLLTARLLGMTLGFNVFTYDYSQPCKKCGAKNGCSP